MPNLRLALRSLARAPFVSGVAVASLALGIGANTAIFSVFERMLIRTLATLLAAIGLYGVLAYAVAQRSREIGVRMALGADAPRVRRLVLRQVAIMTLVGGLIGLAAAIGIGRAARSLLFEVQGHDPVALAGASLVLAAVALGAGYLPARRASTVHPMEALRYE